MYFSTKTYGHEVGLSACFRQWRATSHCNKLHGYALAFKFTFGCNELDERNWVIDFGGLKDLKKALEDMFDHKTVVAADDPDLMLFRSLDKHGMIDLQVLPDVGIEAFARAAWHLGDNWLGRNGHSGRVWLDSVEVNEHGANGGSYQPGILLKGKMDKATKK